MTKKLQIRNSTADFLVFTKENNSSDTIEVRVQDGNVWLTQKAIGQLFDIDRSVVTKHLQNVFADGELVESSTCANFAQVADNGKTYQYKFYSLPAIIAVGCIGIMRNRKFPARKSSGRINVFSILQIAAFFVMEQQRFYGGEFIIKSGLIPRFATC